MKTEPHVLIVGGSDSSGGAGVVRDVETVGAFGLKSCMSVTAITAQTHGKVCAVQPLDTALVADQMLAALSANDVRAIKIGMLAKVETVRAVASVIGLNRQIPVVLDPVLAASSGALLLEEAGIEAMLKDLFPNCDLVTPNLPELKRLAGEPDIAASCSRLQGYGARAILVKGGHADGGDANDILYGIRAVPKVFEGRRYPGAMRGTGCMLASAIAANLARGETLTKAIKEAKLYVSLQFSGQPKPARMGAVEERAIANRQSGAS